MPFFLEKKARVAGVVGIGLIVEDMVVLNIFLKMSAH